MYLLAVCAKFKHRKLSTDTYAVVGKICTDGFKLLMFYRFCNSAAKILHTQGIFFFSLINKYYIILIVDLI